MWPKVFAQLVELLPHVSRLIPMADLFFTTKTSSEKANEAALQTLTTEVRGGLGKVTAAHEGLYRQLQGLGTAVDQVREDTARSRFAAESQTQRLAALEGQVAALLLWVRITAGGIALALVGLVALLLRSR